MTVKEIDYSKHIPLAKKACDFLTESPDPFHAINNVVTKLKEHDFTKLVPSLPFTGKLEPGNKYYYTLNGSSIVAFAIGKNYKPGNGFKIIGGHTDSPNIKVKPNSKKSEKSQGCIQLGVECYGGGLWHTWFDRDLGISGRVLLRSEDDKIESKLIKITTPIARISTLCIHLQTADERSAFKVNKEDHLAPIIGTILGGDSKNDVGSQLEQSVKEQINATIEEEESTNWHKLQEPLLLKRIAQTLNTTISNIVDFELNLFDVQGATLGGIQNEFLYSARLDNLATCFIAMESLIDYSDNFLDDDEDISLIVLFDHEEIGSETAEGAGSPIMCEAINRISSALNAGIVYPDIYASTIQKSFLFSVDMAHAVHPNYSNKHEKNHGPKLNNGITIKTNRNQRYATNGITGFIVRELSRMMKNDIQEFVVRNDCGCGSTIGPILSSKTGIRTVDLGMPQLSMHSCREVMGIADLTNGLDLFKAFFEHFRSIDNKLQLD